MVEDEEKKEKVKKEEKVEEEVYSKRINIDYNMLGDILLFLFVTIWVVILIYIPFLFGMVDDVKENWDDYRCSPTILPISGYINKEENLTVSEATQQNFEYCTGAISGSFMEEILQPINYINQGLTNLSGDILVNLQSIRNVISDIRDAIRTIVISIISMVVHFIIGLLKFMLKIFSTFGKMQTIMESIAYSLKSTTLTLGSAWNGPTGDFIRGVANVA
jgi:hypothetical protein